MTAERSSSFYRHLKEVGERLRQRGAGRAVDLNSVIISTSHYEAIRRVFGGASRAEFHANNVVFNESDHYIEDVLRIATGPPRWPLATGEEGLLEAAENENE